MQKIRFLTIFALVAGFLPGCTTNLASNGAEPLGYGEVGIGKRHGAGPDREPLSPRASRSVVPLLTLA